MLPILCLAVALVSFSATAALAGTLTEPGLIDLLNPIRDAISADKPYLACAFALVLVAAIVRRYVSKWVPFFNTSLGSALTVLVGSFGGALAVPLMEQNLSLPIIWPALKVAFFAAGGYSLLKPVMEHIGEKYTWMRPFTALIAWVYTKPDRAKTAAAAGDAAVSANPSHGASGVIGEPKRVE